ncbi:MAG: hypothetical protein IPO87_14715 [Flavobacteriales bacterium]|nr:hypothetical protein [Flavobacteriales bacterium]
MTSISVARNSPEEPITWHDPIRIVIDFQNTGIDDGDLNFNFELYNSEDLLVFIGGARENGSHAPTC